LTSENASPDEVERLFTEPMERLLRLLERGEERLEVRRAELAEVRYALFELSARHGKVDDPRHAGALESLAAELAPPLVRYLLEQSTDLVRVCTLSIDVGAGVEQENIRLNQDLLIDNRFRQQAIYPMDIMDTEEGRAWAQSFAAAGEEQRLSLAPPSEFAIFDQRAVVAVAEWGNVDADYVMIRDPMVIAAFVQLFDRTFDRALPVAPVGEQGGEQGGEDAHLLELLALGLKDETIARYLGCSLRTVRRRVAALMDRHGAQTRFQLGAAAARHDLVAPGTRPDR
jgi:DNA-binding CsgD family transcriptional regulator